MTTDADELAWLVAEVESGSVRRGAWLRNPDDDERFVSALTWSETRYRALQDESVQARALGLFAAVEPSLIANSGLAASQVFSFLNYSAAWVDDRGRTHLEFGRVWKGCERIEQYSRAVLLDDRIIVLSLFVNGSVPTNQLELWLAGWFDAPFEGSAPPARRNLAGELSRD